MPPALHRPLPPDRGSCPIPTALLPREELNRLALLAAQGDREAEDAAIKGVALLVWRKCCERANQHPALAANLDDIFADMLLVASVALRRFRADEGACACTWVANCVMLQLRSRICKYASHLGNGYRGHKVDPAIPEYAATVPVESVQTAAPVRDLDYRLDAAALLGHLPAREAQVVTDRFRGVTLKAIGERLGLSRERVRQIEGQAMRKVEIVARRDAWGCEL